MAVRRFLLLLIALCCQLTAYEHYSDSDFLVRVWQSDEGLPGNVVRSIGQTPDGFLWIATAEGVTRFDGINFEAVTGTQTDKKHNPDFFRIFTPNDGSVWASTYKHGLYRIHDRKAEYVTGGEEETAVHLITRLIVFDGEVYFFRNQSIWKLEGNEALEIPSPTHELKQALDENLLEQEKRGRLDNNLLPTRLIDSDGGTWLIENKSLSYQSPDQSKPPQQMPDFKNRIVVHDMLEDMEGNIWLSSPVQGLVRIRHRQVTYIPTTEGAYDYASNTGIQTRDGTWWIASRNGGIDHIHNHIVSHIPVVSSGIVRAISCIFEDSADRLWFASRDGSVFELNRETHEIEARFTKITEASKVSDIIEDKEGSLWFAGMQGLCRWDGQDVEIFSDIPLLANKQFSALALDPEGRLFAGTVDGQIFCFDGENFTQIKKQDPQREDSLRRQWISGILPLGQDEIWCTTIGNGLSLFKDGKWQRFGNKDGMPDDRLTAITLIGDNFWIGSLGGILRVSREDLLNSYKEMPRWLQLDRSDGLFTRECVGGAQPGVFHGKAGTLWFPTIAGLAGVRPEQIPIGNIAPPVYLKSVEINGQPQAVQSSSIITGSGRTRLGFQFMGLSLSAPENVTYRARIRGLDDDFKHLGSQSDITYEAVPPGKYIFEVYALNSYGLQSLKPATLEVRIHPHFWETRWFLVTNIIAAILVSIAAGWLVNRRRMTQKIREMRLKAVLQAERTRISRDLHDDLGARLTEVSILSALAAEENRDKQLQPSLHNLSFKANRVVASLDEIVWATNPSQDSLKSLVEYLTFFAREFLKSVQIPLHTDTPREIPDLMIGPNRRHNVMLATREAINNAVKHAKPQSVSLKISIEESQLKVLISDDGRGFTVETPNPGDGLLNLRRRMENCGGSCEINSQPNQGTEVSLLLPLSP